MKCPKTFQITTLAPSFRHPRRSPESLRECQRLVQTFVTSLLQSIAFDLLTSYKKTNLLPRDIFFSRLRSPLYV